MYKKILLSGSMALLLFVGSAGLVLAHVTVRPAEVGVGTFETFTLGVPTEKGVATMGVRLVIPEGLAHVSPNVKPGWNIEIKKEGEVVKELVWTGGTIPAGQRDQFLFSAQAPAQSGSLAWKAYQSYADGSVVSWELGPDQEQPKNESGTNDYSSVGPYSQTKVVDDLSGAEAGGHGAEGAPAATTDNNSSANKSSMALSVGLVALVFSVIALARRRK